MANENNTESAAQRRLCPDSFASSVAILLVVSVVQRSIGFGRGMLFCRWLTPEELGQWEMAYSFLLLASPLVVIGLPGSFGRYLEHYRQQNQLHTFLRRSIVWTAGLALLAITLLVIAAPSFSNLVFGRPDGQTLVILLAGSLAAVILHHFLEALFAAMRKFRIVSMMHVCQSLLFATISLSLLWWWRAGAESIVIGYGTACLISSIGTLLWTGKALLGELDSPEQAIPHSQFWPPLMRFAIWVWVTNLFYHLFEVIDRFMIVHHGGMDPASALTQVGYYHSSRIVPMLLVSVAGLMSTAILPYMVHDWEAGRRREVSDLLNLVLKLTTIGMMAAGVAILWLTPWLFRIAFDGKYDDGLAVLPWTLVGAVWCGLLTIMQNYVWCAERTRIGVVPVVLGIFANIALNLILLPLWGLLGAVVATASATALAIGVLFVVNRQAGMEIQSGTLWLALTPLSLGGGGWCGLVVFMALIPVALFTRAFFTVDERAILTKYVRERLEAWDTWVPNRSERGATEHAIH